LALAPPFGEDNGLVVPANFGAEPKEFPCVCTQRGRYTRLDAVVEMAPTLAIATADHWLIECLSSCHDLLPFYL
jgi:hypothetical protein